jgi:hypothetical protein
MTRSFSGIEPTGHMALRDYLGAITWAPGAEGRAGRPGGEALFCVVDVYVSV